MPSIPNTQRYYPSIPVYELTDLYSKGANTLGGKRIFMASYLPKTLRLSEDHPFNNQYILFVEDTPLVNSIDWEYQLHQNGEEVSIPNFVSVIPSTEATKYSLFFAKDSIDAMSVPVADKLTVKCTVELGPETVVLEVEHDLVQALDNDLSNVEEDEGLCAPHQGNPQTTEYILNHLKDFLPKGEIKWNDKLIEEDLTEEKENNLLKMVIGIIYYNIQSGINETTGFEFLYNIDQDRDKSIETFLNEGKTNKGDYTNGLCKIPLYVLNEILEDVTSVPEFAEIDSGDGSPVFNIIRGQGETSTEEKIETSKTKLESDTERYIELFNLSLFPKSAIRLCALVVKYLFESSIKNECNECKYRLPAWKDVSFDELPQKPMFVRNILTLYLGGPTDKIKKILREAKRTKALIWSPFVDIIVNISPRIVKAYFAERVITKLDDEMIGGVATPVYTFAFKRLDAAQTKFDVNGVRLDPQPLYDSILGREIFLVVETLNARGQELTMNINPLNTTLNNSTDDLRLRNGIAVDTYSTDIVSVIGDTKDLVTNTFAPFGDTINEYLNIDFKDKAIIKLRLHPENRVTHNTWVNHLQANTGQLMISGKFTDERACYFGNDFSQTAIRGEFLCANDKYMVTHFRVVNRIVYEIHHKDDPWNFLTDNGGNRNKIGRVNNEYIESMPDNSPSIAIRKAVYLYFSQKHDEVYIESCDFSKPRKRRDNAITIVDHGPNASNPVNVPRAGLLRDAPAPAGGDAFHNYYYNDGSIVTIDNFRRPAGGDGDALDYGVIRYPLDSPLANVNDVVELVRLPDDLDLTFDYDGVPQRINYRFENTARKYANPSCFAGLIGAFAQTNFTDNIVKGLCFGDATSYPSVTHPNGDSIDLSHRIPEAERITLVDAFRDDWSFGDIVTGNAAIHRRERAHGRNRRHNSHLHAGGFDTNDIEVII